MPKPFLPALLALLLALPALADPRDLLVVLDCSGSMLGQTPDGAVKLDAAKGVLAKLVEKFPADLNAGLLAYGHRVSAGDPGTCTDIELVVPVGPADKAALAAKVRSLQGRGRTPIAASLQKAGETLKALGTERPKSLILVTDGVETCGGDPKAAAAALREMGIQLDFVVIGFDRAESEAKAIAAIAEAGKGKYLDAKSARDLEKAFEKVHEAVVVRAPEVGRDEIVGGGGPATLAFVGWKEGEYPVAGVLVATRTDEVKDVPRGESHGMTFVDFHGLGARVTEVAEESPAAKAGIERGDLVVRADDAAVSTAKTFADFLAAPAVAEDAGRPWRLRVARFPLACEVLATWLEPPAQEIASGEYYVFFSGSRGNGDVGAEGIESNALRAAGSWLTPVRWGLRIEPKMTVEIPLNTGFRFAAGQVKHDPEDEVRIVDDRLGIEVLRFSAATLGRYEWEESPAVIALPPGTYSMEWRRREGKTWFGIVKGHVYDGNKLVEVKF